jgi:hypothetical protein
VSPSRGETGQRERQTTRAFDAVPEKGPPWTFSTFTESVTEASAFALDPISAVVDPTTWPERSTSILQERSPSTGLTTKLTRSVGVSFVPESGLFGSRTAVTEETLTTGFLDVAGACELRPAVDFGEVVLQPANDAPTHSAAARTAKARITEQS